MSNKSIEEMLRRTPGCPSDLCARMFRFFKRMDLVTGLEGMAADDDNDDSNVIYFSHMANSSIDEYDAITRGLKNDRSIQSTLRQMGMTSPKRQADFCSMMLMLFRGGSIDANTEL